MKNSMEYMSLNAISLKEISIMLHQQFLSPLLLFTVRTYRYALVSELSLTLAGTTVKKRITLNITDLTERYDI